MARPSITPESIVVAFDDDLLVWTDGLLGGTNKDLVESARIAGLAEFETMLTLDGPSVSASLERYEHPSRIVAALLAASPGRGRVLQAPPEVLAMFTPGWEDDEIGDIVTASSGDLPS